MEYPAASTITSFFKVLMSDFQQKLNLPPSISKEVEKCKSQKAVLESRSGRWEIGLSKNSEDDLICFKRGWPEFVRRHSLTIGDFLVFQPTKHLHFNVSVFDLTACEKEFPDQTNNAVEALDLSLTTEDEAPYFVKTMQPQHAGKNVTVNIPRGFLRSNATLRDPGGRAWRVSLVVGGRDGVRERMSSGWHHFYASNALTHGRR